MNLFEFIEDKKVIKSQLWIWTFLLAQIRDFLLPKVAVTDKKQFLKVTKYPGLCLSLASLSKKSKLNVFPKYKWTPVVTEHSS